MVPVGQVVQFGAQPVDGLAQGLELLLDPGAPAVRGVEFRAGGVQGGLVFGERSDVLLQQRRVIVQRVYLL